MDAAIPSALELEERFHRTKLVVAVSVPKRDTSTFAARLKDHFFRALYIKSVFADPSNSERRLLLLDPEAVGPELSGLPSDLRDLLTSTSGVQVHNDYELETTYGNYGIESVLRELIPDEIDAPSSFEVIGHIAHLNLRANQLPYKHLIGKVIIDVRFLNAPASLTLCAFLFNARGMVGKIRTVVNKIGTIATEFRTFEMELLAGEESFDAEHREGSCRFQFNFKEVYWNSRLQMEHIRLVDIFTKEDVICDMFAGVGPFALPAARTKGCTVHANDLNPRSYHYLQHNARLNKVDGLVQCYNMDAREFVRSLVGSRTAFSHVVMNLPASSELFLDVFREVPRDMFASPPTIHCYMFSNAADPAGDVIKRASDILGNAIVSPSVHRVRDVSPKKYMMCLSFPLFEPAVEAVLVTKRRRIDADDASE